MALYLGNLLVGSSGVLGTDLSLDASRQLALTGTTSIDRSHTLALSGGLLHTGALVNNGTLIDNTGTLATGGATLSSISTLQIGLGGTTRNTQ